MQVGGGVARRGGKRDELTRDRKKLFFVEQTEGEIAGRGTAYWGVVPMSFGGGKSRV